MARALKTVWRLPNSKRRSVYLTLPFTLAQEDEKTATYEEQVETGKAPVIGTISFKKSSLSTPLPPIVRIVLSYHEARPTPAEPRSFTTAFDVDLEEKTLGVGDRVTIVKNRHATVTSPPEWLEQHLGKTGAVLWTTTSGAMVDLFGAATWFPYAELKRGNPETP
jgi:hypothetical protein